MAHAKLASTGEKTRSKLTKRFIESAALKPREFFLWDSELPGLGIRIWPSGRRVFIYQYRTQYRQTRRLVVGQYGELSPERARDIARKWAVEVREGRDPALLRDEALHAPTVAQLASRYLEQHAKLKKKASSVRSDEHNLKNHVLPNLGHSKVVTVTRADITDLHHKMRGTPGAANRVLALLSKMFNLAEKWGLRPDGSNPCRHVERYRERKMERFLSEAELAVLAATLTEAERNKTEEDAAIAAIRLLLFTGARLSEILTLRWDQVDFPQQTIRLEDSKTGAKTIYLSAPALETLSQIKKTKGNPYVIAGAKKGDHLVNLRKPWHRIRERATVKQWMAFAEDRCFELVQMLAQELGREPTHKECLARAKEQHAKLPAGLSNVRLHDLRHSFASMAVAGGLSLPVIGALLGHKSTVTTSRYAHLADDPLQKAATLTGRRISEAMASGTAKPGQ